jgi:hypothetical protein
VSDDEALLAKFFVAETGEIQIAMDDAIPASVLLPVYKVAIVATDAGGGQAVLFEWEFIALASDFDNLAYGPSGTGCGFGTQVDGIPLDAKFTCTCTDTNGYVATREVNFHVFECNRVHMRIHVRVCVHGHTCVCVCARVSVCVCVCVCDCVRKYISIRVYVSA